MAAEYIVKEGRKYMWDGEQYDSEAAARANLAKYQSDGFEVLLVTGEDGQPVLYTRRVVTSPLVEGAPP